MLESAFGILYHSPFTGHLHPFKDAFEINKTANKKPN